MGYIILAYGLVLFTIADFAFMFWFIFTKNNKTWVKKVPYTILVRETILFTGNILQGKKIKHFPGFRICYYKHKKFMGVFNGEVVVYTKSNPDIPTLIDTVLHEVMHYIQSKTDKQYKRYDEFTRTLGYYDNPFEKESRAFAEKYRESCLEYLASKQLINKQ